MPLMNCCGGGLHSSRMAVEFTASACTFCGGAVGTVAAGVAGDGRGRGTGGGETKQKPSALLRLTGHYSAEDGECDECFWTLIVTLRRKRIGLFLIFCC